MSDTTKRASIALIRNKNNEFLLLNRAYAPFGWGLPGGKKEEHDESDLQCVRREVYEETGILLTPKDFEYIGEGVSSTGRILSIYAAEHLTEDESIEISPEHTNYAWVKNTSGLQMAGTTELFIQMCLNK